ncbi:MAG: hypothetical protein RSA99_06075, partial [Oscillospiraceae bacterium]
MKKNRQNLKSEQKTNCVDATQELPKKTGFVKSIPQFKLKKFLLSFGIIFTLISIFPLSCMAAGELNIDVNGGGVDTIQIVIMMTLIALIPSILIMMTSFTRIIIILSFLRNALGVQQVPPNQVLIGIALFLSLFIMSPVISEINTVAYEPYKAQKI